MADELKQKIVEFSKIVKSCPENLQEKCFEILLSDYLSALRRIKPGEGSINEDEGKEQKKEKEPPLEQQDVIEKELHVKARRFLKRYTLSIKEINQLFYKEKGELLPLYEDLNTTKASESQIRITLLQALKNGLISGEFAFDGEQIREECITRKCYDSPNFATIFNKNFNLFDKFGKYKKADSQIKLSEEGRKKLAELIKELQ